MEAIKIAKRPRLRSPYLICAWPGMGEVAFKAATYLIEKLQPEEFAEINPQDYFYTTASVIQEGILSIPQLPYSKFYYWRNKTGKNDLIIFVSNAQPDLARAEGYCQNIISLAKSFKVKRVIGFAASPQPIDHLHAPKVWFSATSTQTRDQLKKYNLDLFAEGAISGMNGLFLGLAKREGLDGFCLLGEIPLYTIQIENPKASYAVLDALNRVLGISLDLAPLLEQSRSFEGEINKLLDFLKLGNPGHGEGPIGEEEIERIKKSLGQLTKLPLSVKDKIDKLFLEAKTDINKATELKAELDNWNIYKEYEDRFLDLFKKSKDKNN
ncbi:MAG: PAC2 family protein [Candidatus Omnitrophica bacterium]|nr:PAC2 family protein [Candidatus Omnitrophota bacterium]